MEGRNHVRKCSTSARDKGCPEVNSYDTRIGNKLPKTLVLPVSGHGLVEQLGIILWLTSRGYKPKTVLGASGGAIVGAIGIIFDWNHEKIIAWLRTIPSFDAFQHRTLGYVEAIYKDSIFTIGPGLTYLFNFISQPKHEEKLRNSELIILTKNESKGRAEIFSTVSNKNSILKDLSGPLDLFGAKCDVEFIGERKQNYLSLVKDVLKATSAVPIVFPPVQIGKYKYTDGGCSFSSPLSPVSSLKQFDEIVYVFPEDIETEIPSTCFNTFEIAKNFLSSISRANYIHDRTAYLHGICCGKFNMLKTNEGDGGQIYDVLTKTGDKKRMVEIYPCISRSLPIMSNHDKEDIIKRANEQLQNIRFRIFSV